MAYNVSPVGEAARISLGGGRLFVNPYVASAGATPSNDVGYGKGGTLNITRQKVEARLGLPRTLIVQYAVQEDVTVGFNSIEWDPFNLRHALGAGETSSAAVQGITYEILEFGGDTRFAEVSVMLQHQMAAGGTLFLDVWKAQGEGELNLNLADDIHEIPYTFRALEAATQFNNTATVDRKKFFRMRVVLS